MTKNPIKLVRNPNSPEAIQNRLDGYGNLQPYEKYHIIDDKKAGHIFIDLTNEKTFQRCSYIMTGGSRHLNRKLVRSSLSLDSQGQPIITSYYTDVHNSQWVVIRGYLNRPITDSNYNSDKPFPRPTFGNTFGGFFASAKGQNWRNEGRSVDEIKETQERVYSTVDIDKSANLEQDHPEDHYEKDFTGSH